MIEPTAADRVEADRIVAEYTDHAKGYTGMAHAIATTLATERERWVDIIEGAAADYEHLDPAGKALRGIAAAESSRPGCGRCHKRIERHGRPAVIDAGGARVCLECDADALEGRNV